MSCTSKWRWPSMRRPLRARARTPRGAGRRAASATVAVGDGVAGAVDALAALAGVGAQLLVGPPLHLGLERVDLGHDRLDRLELAALADVQKPFEDSHSRGECTGEGPELRARRVPGRRVVVPMLAAVRPPIVREPLGRVDRRWFVAAVLAMRGRARRHPRRDDTARPVG